VLSRFPYNRFGNLSNKKARIATRGLAVCVLLLQSAAVLGQASPDAGTILKQLERTEPKPPPPASAPLKLPAEAPPTADARNKLRVLVSDFRISGATLIPEAELKSDLSQFVGKELSFPELRRVALRVSDYYRKRGYFARALLPQQTVENGVVEIAVIEGRLSAIKVETLPGTRISADRVQGYIESEQRTGEPLKPDSIQSGLRNLNDLPGVSTTGVLQPGTAEGDVNLSLRVEEGPVVNGGVTLDNYGLRATGVTRAIAYALLNNPTGYGDQLTATGFATERSTYVRAGYSFALGYSGLRLGAHAAKIDYRLSGAFSGFNGYGEIEGLIFLHPIYRAGRANVFGGFAFDHKHFVNNAAGGINTSNKTSDTLGISGYGDFLDSGFGGGQNAFSLNLVNGRLDLGRNPGDLAADNLGARTQGRFARLEWTFTRLQTLPSEDTLLYFSFAGQAAGKNLDAYERFSLGGPVAVRAYPTGQAIGDQGWVATVELRHKVQGNLQVYGFYDAGHISILKNAFPGSNAANPSAPNSYLLQGAGVGVQYAKAGDFALRTVAAFKIGPNPGKDANGNDVDGGHGRSRIWLQAIKFF
jgi:hemolysin activation/secretion protein